MVGWDLIGILSVLSLVMMLVERTGVRTTLDLHVKGDLKRESRWLAQYGQGACTLAGAVLVWQLDTRSIRIALAVFLAPLVASFACTVIKRSAGRVRPNRENAGKFLGPTLKHANFRESFPSSHSASAVALSATLATFYPSAAVTFWVLGVICALLRYLMDAHWPSDVLGGVAIGGALANLVLLVLGF